jgi:hypothetical protein
MTTPNQSFQNKLIHKANTSPTVQSKSKGIVSTSRGIASTSKTDFFKIPYTNENEKLSANIIENQLVASTKGVFSSVFEDGEYRLIDNVDGTYSVMLVGTGENVALEGILYGGFVYCKDHILWENLQKGYLYHLYIKFTDNLYSDPTAFKAISKQTMKIDNKIFTHLYLASIDLRNGKTVIDTYPDGKLYSCDIASHSNDSKNPHGENLEQESLVITKSLKTNINGKENLIFDESGNGILDKTIRRKIARQIVNSKGINGVKIDIENAVEILQVNAVEACWTGQTPTFKLGEIAVDISSDSCIIYNSGLEELPMHVTIYYEV